MKTNWKSLSLALVGAIAWFALAAAPARAQGFTFGYAGPGVSIRVNGYPPYYGGGFYPGGYYGGYYAGYPPLVPGPLGGGPVFMQPQRIVPAPWIAPGPYFVGRPYGWYGPYRRFYLR
jgi:hypothetical protein